MSGKPFKMCLVSKAKNYIVNPWSLLWDGLYVTDSTVKKTLTSLIPIAKLLDSGAVVGLCFVTNILMYWHSTIYMAFLQGSFMNESNGRDSINWKTCFIYNSRTCLETV